MLSSTGAEQTAMSKAVKEVMFMIQLQQSMKVLSNLPVKIRVDNKGAIFMASNITTTLSTKK